MRYILTQHPLPWSWDDEDWTEFEAKVEDEDVAKYLDLGLSDAKNDYVIPMRVDHGEYILDTTVNNPQPCKEVREFIVLAVNNHDALYEVVRRYVAAEIGGPHLLAAARQALSECEVPE